MGEQTGRVLPGNNSLRLEPLEDRSSSWPIATVWLLVVFLSAAYAGFYIPELYDATGLDQSSTVHWHIELRAVSASLLSLFAVVMAWLVWKRVVLQQGKSAGTRSSQFGLRTAFAITTLVALATSAWTLSYEETEIKFVGFYVSMTLVGLLVGRATFLANPVSSTETNPAASVGVPAQPRRLLFAGLILIALQLGVCWLFEFRHGFSGIVWLVLSVGILWRSERNVRVGTVCFMAAIFLPYVWLLREVDEIGNMIPFLSAAPGIVPAAMVKWTPNSLVPATTFLVIESVIGYLVARRGRTYIAWLAGVACSTSVYASFGLHALFRA